MTQGHARDHAAAGGGVPRESGNRIASRIQRASADVFGVTPFNCYDAAGLDIDPEKSTAPFAAINSKEQFGLGIHGESRLECKIQLRTLQRSPYRREPLADP